MRTVLYTLCWNEADMLPFFFNHYDTWVDRYYIHDDGSTDGSLDILHAHPKVEVRRFERCYPESFVLSHQAFQNETWKESRRDADWMIITALDEHLHLPQASMRDYLEARMADGTTLIPAIGFQMLADDLPSPENRLCDSRTIGAPYDMMNKLSIFNPRAVEPNYTVGRHQAFHDGTVRYPEQDRLMLLHYKYVGFERTIARHRAQQTGLRALDLANKWGFHYSWTPEQLQQEIDSYAANAIDIGAPGFSLAETVPPAARWWRAPVEQQAATD